MNTQKHDINTNGKLSDAAEVCCANCKWASELEERYDQVYCFNQESQEACSNVEATFSCALFLSNVKFTRRDENTETR